MTAVAAPITSRPAKLSSLWLEHQHWTNPRTKTGLEEEDLAELGSSIKTHGLQEFPKVQKIKTASGIIDLVIDGQRRVRAATSALGKHAEIQVIDVSADPIELTPEVGDELLLKALLTIDREPLSSYELLEVAARMQARGKTGAYIADAIGMSTTWVSRMLKARATASPKLMLRWRKDEITDEQFKDLAEIKDEEKQVEAAKEVVEARKSGDKAEGRVRAKELAAGAKADKAKDAKVANGHNKEAKPVVKGPQLDLLEKERDKAAEEKAEAKKLAPKPPSRHAIDDLLAMADKRPPLHDLVKGIMLGVKYAIGTVEPDAFGKPWMQYVSRVEGAPRPAKKVKPAKKAAAKKSAPPKARPVAKKKAVAKKAKK
jgi:ParB/RepB/Spo0J family partition protein